MELTHGQLRRHGLLIEVEDVPSTRFMIEQASGANLQPRSKRIARALERLRGDLEYAEESGLASLEVRNKTKLRILANIGHDIQYPFLTRYHDDAVAAAGRVTATLAPMGLNKKNRVVDVLGFPQD